MKFGERCGNHGDGAALRRSGRRCGRCGWNGLQADMPVPDRPVETWAQLRSVKADYRVKGYNGRSAAARRRDVKPNDHVEGRLDYYGRGELRRAVHGGSQRMARDHAPMVAAYVDRSSDVAALLAAYGI